MSAGKLAEALAQFGEAYSSRYPYSPEQRQVVTSINDCRTAALGGMHIKCNDCERNTLQFHSCRNRHCPQCQKQASKDWLDKRQADLLPIPYFHLVFTLPHNLNGWARIHPREVYGLLFQAVWATLQKFGRDPKRLDGQLGVTAVLHTWGQTLDQHIHLHCLIPAGAWSEGEGCWHAARSNYLFPVKALSRCYRGKMVSLLRKARTAGELSKISDEQEVKETLNEVMKINWVVYTKACHGKPERTLAYLSRYTYRIAISESRIETVGEEKVSFRWKDYRDNRKKIMRLNGVEFLRRFLQHVLPKRFMRIRHFGFLSNRCRRSNLEKINEAMREGTKKIHKQTKKEKVPVNKSNGIVEQTQVSPWYCCHCQSQSVRSIRRLEPLKRRRK